MIIDYKVLRTDGSIEEGQLNTDASLYDAVKKLFRATIGNGDLEHVTVYDDSWDEGGPRYRDMFVDEVGSWKNLPMNRQATKIYHANALEHRAEFAGLIDYDDMALIFGDALLCRQEMWK